MSRAGGSASTAPGWRRAASCSATAESAQLPAVRRTQRALGPARPTDMERVVVPVVVVHGLPVRAVDADVDHVLARREVEALERKLHACAAVDPTEAHPARARVELAAEHVVRAAPDRDRDDRIVDGASRAHAECDRKPIAGLDL